jgi:hypothetical protein
MMPQRNFGFRFPLPKFDIRNNLFLKKETAFSNRTQKGHTMKSFLDLKNDFIFKKLLERRRTKIFE